MRSWFARLGGLGVLALSACTPPPNQFVPPPPPEVTVALPEARRVAQTLEATGTTRAEVVVEVRARVRGFVQSRHVEGGQMVAAGDLMYVIDPREYEAVVARTQAELEAARVALRLAEIEQRRIADLVAREAASAIETDRAIAARDAAKAQLALAEANLQTAQLDLEWTQVRAPIDGRLGIDTIDVGQLVGASEPTLMGVIMNDTLIYASFNLPEREVLELRYQNSNRRPGEQGRPNLNFRLAMANETDYAHWGAFHKSDNTIDPATGTIAVEALFDNADSAILPGLFVRIQALLDEVDALLVPDVAVQSDQAGRYVLVANAENVVERRNVVTGPAYGRLRRIDAGLRPDERVIVNGLQRARPGAPVRATLAAAEANGDSSVTSQPAGAAPASAPAGE